MSGTGNLEFVQFVLVRQHFRISAKIPLIPGIAFYVGGAIKKPHRLPSEDRNSSLFDRTKGAGTNADDRRPPALAGTRAGTLAHSPGRRAVDLLDIMGVKCAATIWAILCLI